MMTAAPGGKPPLLLIEAGFTLISIALAFCWPRAGSAMFSKLEAMLGQVARRRTLSVLVVGIGACMLRLLILPLSPVPQPYVHDDFSLLLAADTFSSGRLTNPTHPMWVHFESFHITQKPTYMSMYFPAQGMVLAAAKLLTRQPWFGVLVSCGLMCAAICWMLQGWLPPGWALFGGMLAALRLGLFSYWIDTYMGGPVPAIGGALVLGAVPRLRSAFRGRDFAWLAGGMAILATSRPYEGLLVSIPAAVVLCWRFITKPHPHVAVLARRLTPAAALLAFTAIFMGYYNYRVFGNVFTPPYAIDRATYASVPHFVWQSAKPEPVYRHSVMRDFYSGFERAYFLKGRTASGLLSNTATKLGNNALFFFGIALLPPLAMLPRVVRDTRVRFLVVTAGVFALGLCGEVWLNPHYLAPFVAGLYALLLQAMRHLRVWRPAGAPSGLALVRLLALTCILMTGVRLYAGPLKIDLGAWPSMEWYGPPTRGDRRARVLAELESYPGQQLAIVRYARDHDSFDEWVYNAARIDSSRVVWARDMDPASNAELLRYFKHRKVWLIQPDFDPPKVSPYPSENPPCQGGNSRFASVATQGCDRQTPDQRAKWASR
jgi:hypothetical protein